MRAHVIENGVVVNTIEVDDLDFMPNLISGNEGGIGWLWDGKTLTDPNAPTDEERIAAQWAVVRTARNSKLAACDWTQLPDAPVDAAVWATYRQALRDVTTQNDPFNIVWPTPPAFEGTA